MWKCTTAVVWLFDDERSDYVVRSATCGMYDSTEAAEVITFPESLFLFKFLVFYSFSFMKYPDLLFYWENQAFLVAFIPLIWKITWWVCEMLILWSSLELKLGRLMLFILLYLIARISASSVFVLCSWLLYSLLYANTEVRMITAYFFLRECLHCGVFCFSWFTYEGVFRLSSCSHGGMGRIVFCFPVFSVVAEMIPQSMLCIGMLYYLTRKLVQIDNFVSK